MRTPEQEVKQKSSLQRRIDTILTVLFLVTIVVFGVMTVAQDPLKFARAFGGKDRVRSFLVDPEHAKPWDYLAASVQSADAYIAENCWHATELGYANSTLQYGLGKRLVTTGSSQMLTLNTGHLYDLQEYTSMDKAFSDIEAMKALCGDIPYLFVYEHPTLYSDEQMPVEYACLDHSAEMADEITDQLESSGIKFLDSRKVLTESGMELGEYLMVTDQHWATRASIEMTQRIAETVSAMTGVELDTSRIGMDQMNTQTYEKLFLGKYGQRIGTGNVDPDDITIYWPKYETNIHRDTLYLKESFDLEGPFYDSCIRWRYLEPDPGKTYNIKAYFDYGLTENYDIFENADGADLTIMLLKDSYSASMGSFLSLMAKKVVAIDLRRSDVGLAELIETYKPDVVVHAYSLQMLKQDEYEFQ